MADEALIEKYLDTAKAAIRVRSTAYDAEIKLLIGAALDEIAHQGLRTVFDSKNATAVAVYVKAYFGSKTATITTFQDIWKKTLMNLAIDSDRREPTADEILASLKGG